MKTMVLDKIVYVQRMKKSLKEMNKTRKKYKNSKYKDDVLDSALKYKVIKFLKHFELFMDSIGLYESNEVKKFKRDKELKYIRCFIDNLVENKIVKKNIAECIKELWSYRVDISHDDIEVDGKELAKFIKENKETFKKFIDNLDENIDADFSVEQFSKLGLI